MKKTSLYSLTAVAAISALSLVAPLSTYAADEVEVKTDANAGFSTSGDYDDMPVVKPGTDTEITPENALTTKPHANDVVLSYAPNFYFGTNNKISLSNGTKEYNSKNNTFQNLNDATNNYEIPQFAQVADASGENYRAWSLTLQQDAIFKDDTAGTPNTLTNTRIRIKGQTTTNNLITTNVADALTGLSIPTTGATQYTQVPVAGDGNAIVVLKSNADKTKTNGSTNGTKSSVVFKNGYVETNYNTVSTAATVDARNENTDVVLAVPSTDQVLKKQYSAKLVWTLSSTPN